MWMKVLLAVDNSVGSRKAIKAVTKLLKGIPTEMTLIHVTEKLPYFVMQQAASQGTGNMFAKVVEEWTRENDHRGHTLLSNCKDQLVEAGFAADKISCQLSTVEALPEARRVADAGAIIATMQSGDFDLIVLGRREDPEALPFVGSVAQKVLNEAGGRTVWIVDSDGNP